MKGNKTVYSMTIAALLCAIGIVIPMFSPVKLVLPTMSFTLASHVAIFIAMFISPFTAVAVSLGTTLGFFLGGFPIMVVMRAASHLVFSAGGAFILKKKPELIAGWRSALLFSFCVGVVHALCEVLVVTPLFFGGGASGGFWAGVMLPVGIGTLGHSMVDFEISRFIWKPLSKALKRVA